MSAPGFGDEKFCERYRELVDAGMKPSEAVIRVQLEMAHPDWRTSTEVPRLGIPVIVTGIWPETNELWKGGVCAMCGEKWAQGHECEPERKGFEFL